MTSQLLEIEVCQRLMDHWLRKEDDGTIVQAPKFHASIKGQLGFWGCGTSKETAVGDLIGSHYKRFGLESPPLNYIDQLNLGTQAYHEPDLFNVEEITFIGIQAR